MEYLVKRTKISEQLVEVKKVPVGDPPPERELNPAGIEKLAELKRNYSLKEMARPEERAKISEEMARREI